jgi:phytoene synthase
MSAVLAPLPANSEELARRAQAVMDRHARTFASAALFFSPAMRADAAMLYAFARAADDLCDEESLGPLDERLATLDALGRCAARAQIGLADGGDAMATATGHVLRRHGVHPHVLHHFLSGLRDDAQPRQVKTTDELLQFAFAVAGTVGQMMLPMLGAPAEAERYAIALGIAMQLTNVARDVQEDALRGRCYLPAEWDADWQQEAGLDSDNQRARAFTMVQRLLALADDFYAFAAPGLTAIPTRNRRAVRIAAALYQAIGHKILKIGPAQYWQGRVCLSRMERGSLILRTVMRPELGPPNVLLVRRADSAQRADRSTASDFLRMLPGYRATGLRSLA